MRRMPLLALMLALVSRPALAAPFDSYYEIEAGLLPLAAGGYSLYGGYAWGTLRASFGIFGLDVPEFFRGNNGWNMRVDGASIALDYYPCCSTAGFFFGPQAGLAAAKFERIDTGRSTTRTQFGLGGRAGYRFMFGETGFFIAPWLGIEYVFPSGDVAVDGRTFTCYPVRLVPAVNLGWRF